MKKIKLTSIALVALMAVNTLAMTTSADIEIAEEVVFDDYVGLPNPFAGESSSDNSDVAMKAALTKVKQRISIPKALTEFSYNQYTNNGITTYNFNWSNKSDELEADGTHLYKSMRVSITGDIITSYSYEDGVYQSWSTPQLAKLSDTSLLSKAKTSLKKINPTIYSQAVVTSGGVSINGNTATFQISRQFNGVDVKNNYGSITVDKNTGEVKRLNVTWWDNAGFKKKANAITEEKYIETYKSLNKLIPYYTVETDYETGKKTTKVVYIPTFSEEIDAITGKPSTMNDDRNSMYNNKDYGASEGVDGEVEEDVAEFDDVSAGEGIAVTFTPSETKAIKENEKLLTKAKVTEILQKDKYIKISSDMVCSSSNLYEEKNNYTDTSKYYWNMSFSNNNNKTYKSLSVKIDAETGKILNFNSYNYTQNETLPVLDVAKSNTIAQEAMKYYLPDIYKKYKADETNTKEVTYWGKDNKYFDTSRTFKFNRFENGIQVMGDDIRISVDSNGNVTSFSYNPTDDVVFKKQTLISTEDAYKQLFTQLKPRLYHTGYVDLKGKAKTYLVYSLDGYTLDAKTGKIYGYDTIEDEVNTKYTDIKGNYAEKAITELARHGVTLETKDGKFEPNKIITESEFSILCSNVFNNYEIYRYYTTNNTDAKTKKVVDNKLTKVAACKYFVKALGAEEYAKIKGIYTTPFKDVSSTNADIGYIAICYGKGAIKYDSSAKFNATKEMTRADAMQMIYNYLKAQE